MTVGGVFGSGPKRGAFHDRRTLINKPCTAAAKARKARLPLIHPIDMYGAYFPCGILPCMYRKIRRVYRSPSNHGCPEGTEFPQQIPPDSSDKLDMLQGWLCCPRIRSPPGSLNTPPSLATGCRYLVGTQWGTRTLVDSMYLEDTRTLLSRPLAAGTRRPGYRLVETIFRARNGGEKVVVHLGLEAVGIAPTGCKVCDASRWATLQAIYVHRLSCIWPDKVLCRGAPA